MIELTSSAKVSDILSDASASPDGEEVDHPHAVSSSPAFPSSPISKKDSFGLASSASLKSSSSVWTRAGRVQPGETVAPRKDDADSDDERDIVAESCTGA